MSPDDQPKPESVNSADETVLPSRGDADSTQIGGSAPAVPESPAAAPVGSARALLGVIAIYSPTAGEPTDPPSQAGRVFPLHEGDVLFVGKEEPQELPLRDGGVLRITHAHILTRDNEYSHTSREHLALEMLPGGRFRIYDYSLNGVFLEEAQKHLRRGNVRPEVHEIEGNETLVLGINLMELRDRAARRSAARSRIQVFPIGGGSGPVGRAEPTAGSPVAGSAPTMPDPDETAT